MAKVKRRAHFLRATLAIARNAIGEALHRIIFQVILLFGVLLVVGGSFFTYMAPAEEHKMLTDLGLSIIAAFGMMLAIFMGVMTFQSRPRHPSSRHCSRLSRRLRPGGPSRANHRPGLRDTPAAYARQQRPR